MKSLLTIAVMTGALAGGSALAQSNGEENGNGAKVRKDGFLLNVIAYDQCPSGDFVDSNRRHIALQADYSSNGPDKTDKINKIFLMAGDDFWVQDGNACDDGANFYLPLSPENCAGDCSIEEPTFTEYAVRVRLVGRPNSGVEITSCLDAFLADTNGDGVIDENDELVPLCSVGDGNIVVQTRIVGNGKEQNKWENVSTELLTVCVDTDANGTCDDRIGLFDAFGENYWWSWSTNGRPHMQLVFYPVSAGIL